MRQNTQDQPETHYPRFRPSAKLVILTVIFVMTAGVFIFVPAIAAYRVNWLNDRLAAAYTAALVMEAANSRTIPESLRQRILDSIGTKSVVMKIDQSRHLLALSDNPGVLHQQIDLRDVSTFGAIVGAFETIFLRSDEDLIRATGPAPMGGGSIEIVLEERPLRRAMFEFSIYLMMGSLFISGIASVLVFFALNLRTASLH